MDNFATHHYGAYAHHTPAYEHHYDNVPHYNDPAPHYVSHGAAVDHGYSHYAEHGYAPFADHAYGAVAGHDAYDHSVFYSHPGRDHHVDQHVHAQYITTPVTQMVDSAVDNLTYAMAYLHLHPKLPHFEHIMNLLNDAALNLKHFKGQHQRGHLTAHYLEEVRGELVAIGHDLDLGWGVTEDRLRDYIEAALHEIYVAQHVEMYGAWPDGVPVFNDHGEFTSDYPPLAHHDYAGYTTHGSHHYAANGIEDALNAAAADENASSEDPITINIKGPVVIAGEAPQDLAALLRQTIEAPSASSGAELSPREQARLMSLQGLPPQPQQSNWRSQMYSGAGQAQQWAGQAQQLPQWMPYSDQIKQGAQYASQGASALQGVAGMMGGGQPGQFDQYAGQTIGAIGNIGQQIGGKYGGMISQGAQYAQQGMNMYEQAKPWLQPMAGMAKKGWSALSGWWGRRK